MKQFSMVRTIIVVKGINKEKVGQYAAEIRARESYRNPTRARVSSMLMKLSDVKSVRLVRNNERSKRKWLARSHRAVVRENKHRRLRNRFSGTAARPRLAVFRSNNHMYAQIIDDTVGKTLVSASTLDKED